MAAEMKEYLFPVTKHLPEQILSSCNWKQHLRLKCSYMNIMCVNNNKYAASYQNYMKNKQIKHVDKNRVFIFSKC